VFALYPATSHAPPKCYERYIADFIIKYAAFICVVQAANPAHGCYATSMIFNTDLELKTIVIIDLFCHINHIVQFAVSHVIDILIDRLGQQFLLMLLSCVQIYSQSVNVRKHQMLHSALQGVLIMNDLFIDCLIDYAVNVSIITSTRSTTVY
jgi:hypothetical protein